ncbi:hypothetical protein [Kribbella sp. NPDC049584]|uniref:hypothetical protein n=1 Tax=Kribbella sp. NPDC049584 TaxID=3154833 RepID=UPI00342D201F
MTQPIYKLWLMKRATEAYFQLSEAERDQHFAKLEQALEQVGGKMVIFCDSAWSSEQWQAFGVEEYPDIEAVQKLTAIHEEIQHFRFLESMTVLGTKSELGS